MDVEDVSQQEGSSKADAVTLESESGQETSIDVENVDSALKDTEDHFEENQSAQDENENSEDWDDDLSTIPTDTEDYQLEVKRVTLAWYHLNVTSKVTRSKLLMCCPRAGPPPVFKRMLIDVSGEVRPGQLLAVMGSSGAGKTTLMNAITGRNLSRIIVSGAIHMNGRKITEKMKKLVSYVEQEDIFFGGLTVREHLVFQALLRMKKSLPWKTKMARVDEVMTQLRLHNCARTVIGIPGRVKGASGGEKKRLAFASELLTNPSVMFCDEPTSGLDSFMAESVVSVLKELADGGRTILCTIHQPSSSVYAMFNNIMFLANGRVAFLGTAEDAMEFFESIGLVCPRNYNPADFYVGKLSVVSGAEDASRSLITEICDAYIQTNYARRFTITDVHIEETVHRASRLPSQARKKSPWYYQFWILYRRSVLSLSREPMLTTARLTQAFIIGAIVGVLFWQQKMTQEGVMNINGAIFMMLTNITIQNGFAVMTTFCEEIPVFLREYSGGVYRISTYFVAKSSAEVPVFIAIPTVTATMTYWTVGLRSTLVGYLNLLTVAWLVANTGVSYGYCISCMTTSPTMAVAIAPPLFVPMMIFGGYFLNVKSVPLFLNWLKYLSWYHYSFEILVINQWAPIDHIKCDKKDKTACLDTGRKIINYFNFSEDNFYFDYAMLVALLLFYRFIAFLMLVMKVKLRNVF